MVLLFFCPSYIAGEQEIYMVIDLKKLTTETRNSATMKLDGMTPCIWYLALK